MNRRIEKIVITVETFRRTSVRLWRANGAWCGYCNAETAMIAPDEAAAYLRCSVRGIFRLAETGTVHSQLTKSGSLLVCGMCCRSLEARL